MATMGTRISRGTKAMPLFRRVLLFFVLVSPIILGTCTSGTPVVNSLWTQPTVSTATWSAVGAVGFTPGATGTNIVSLAPDGTPFVEFTDWNVPGGWASVEKYQNGFWSFVGTEGFSLGTISESAFDFDANGVPYVAYQDTPSTRLVVAFYDGSSWVSPPGPQSLIGTGSASSISLVIDNQGRPCVAFSDGTVSGGVTVIRWNTTTVSWDTLGSAGFSGIGASSTSIAKDAAGNLYVAYVDGSAGNNLSVVKFDGSVWNYVGSRGFSPSSVGSPSLRIGPDGIPYVAFMDAALNEAVTVMKYVGGTWTVVGKRGFSAGWAWGPSLVVNTGDVLYVGYQDTINGNSAVVQKFTGTDWTSVGSSTGVSAGDIQSPSMAVDSSGALYIGYRDNANSSHFTVLRY